MTTAPTSPRKTLAHPAEVRGVSLFMGVQSMLRMMPAAAGHGIAFVRTDAPGAGPIAALASQVMPESRRTVLAQNPADRAAAMATGVQTVEHVLSALAGLGVTDVLVEVGGPEAPIGDGSALLFVEAIERAGVRDLPGSRVAPIVIRETITVEDALGGRVVAEASDAPGLELIYHLDYGPGAPMPAQMASWRCPPGGDGGSYRREVAPARTFSTLAEATAMRAMGMFAHLSPRDMLVIGPSGPVENTYRFENEPARHKLLDLMGDLSLAGRPIQGRVTAWRSGHALNHAMARRLAELPG